MAEECREKCLFCEENPSVEEFGVFCSESCQNDWDFWWALGFDCESKPD